MTFIAEKANNGLGILVSRSDELQTIRLLFDSSDADDGQYAGVEIVYPKLAARKLVMALFMLKSDYFDGIGDIRYDAVSNTVHLIFDKSSVIEGSKSEIELVMPKNTAYELALAINRGIKELNKNII